MYLLFLAIKNPSWVTICEYLDAVKFCLLRESRWSKTSIIVSFTVWQLSGITLYLCFVLFYGYTDDPSMFPLEMLSVKRTEWICDL